MRLLFFFLGFLSITQAQPFTSASTGADGALDLMIPGTVAFASQAFHRQAKPSRNDVYHFTTIHIGKGVIVRLSSGHLTGAVLWLAQGPVQIDGRVELDGADGGLVPSLAGAGGFPGGAPGAPGYGPVGFTRNLYLVPLVGGNGGRGGPNAGGGAGGGALLIASSTSVTINGSITANGGNSPDGIGGSGGSIRLVAPIIDGDGGVITAQGGKPDGPDGLVRFECFENRFAGDLNGTPSAQGRPLGLFLAPDAPAAVQVVSINGRPVTAASLQEGNHAELSLGRPDPVTLGLEAHSIPPGTILELEVFPDHGPPQIIKTPALRGTFSTSWVTVSGIFPQGLSHLQIRASWIRSARALEGQR